MTYKTLHRTLKIEHCFCKHLCDLIDQCNCILKRFISPFSSIDEYTQQGMSYSLILLNNWRFKGNRTLFLCVRSNGHHNTELKSVKTQLVLKDTIIHVRPKLKWSMRIISPFSSIDEYTQQGMSYSLILYAFWRYTS
jgi:hypothetical protein